MMADWEKVSKKMEAQRERAEKRKARDERRAAQAAAREALSQAEGKERAKRLKEEFEDVPTDMLQFVVDRKAARNKAIVYVAIAVMGVLGIATLVALGHSLFLWVGDHGLTPGASFVIAVVVPALALCIACEGVVCATWGLSIEFFCGPEYEELCRRKCEWPW